MKRIEKILLCGSRNNVSIALKINIVAGNFVFPSISSDEHSVAGTINWGDGTIDDYQTNISHQHTYEADGIYTISITLESDSPNNELFMANRFEHSTDVLEVHINCHFDKILDEAFNGCTNIQIANLPGVRNIGKEAFSSCWSLKNINFDNVCTIGTDEEYSYTFNYCKNLEEIVLPSTLTMLAPMTFNECSSLKKVHFASTSEEQTIGEGAFCVCRSLEEVIIESNLKKIPDHCFHCCTSLQKITLPSSITEIGEYAFFGVDKEFDIYYDDTVEKWNNITKLLNWNTACEEITVHCTDGNVTIPSYYA